MLDPNTITQGYYWAKTNDSDETMIVEVYLFNAYMLKPELHVFEMRDEIAHSVSDYKFLAPIEPYHES